MWYEKGGWTYILSAKLMASQQPVSLATSRSKPCEERDRTNPIKVDLNYEDTRDAVGFSVHVASGGRTHEASTPF